MIPPPIKAYMLGTSLTNINTHTGFNNASTNDNKELFTGLVSLIPFEKNTYASPT